MIFTFPKLNIFSLAALLATSSTVLTSIAEEKATISIDSNTLVAKTKNNRLLGGNIALWYTPKQLEQLENSDFYKQWQPGVMRIPGGSWSDEYFWNGNGVRDANKFDLSKRDGRKWDVDYSDWKPGFKLENKDLKDGSLSDFHGHTDVLNLHKFAHKNSPDAMVTVNAGFGTPKMAAEWVRWANKKKGFNVKYWEVGNELEGDWELGNIRPDGTKMDAQKYAALYIEFAKAMKAVDPTIKVGGPTNSSDSVVYVEELIKQAGDHIDFISFHTYPVDARLIDSNAIMNETARVSKATELIRGWLKKYQPERADQIEICITEWHVQVHENDNTCNLLSGIWCTRFIGEMFKSRIDFANQWDTFSTTSHGGHGLFAEENITTPRATYWALWMWANHMGDNLVKSTVSGNPNVVSFATMDGDTPAILLINQSSEKSVVANLTGFDHKNARAIEFSHANYLWHPFNKEPVWSLAPVERNIDLTKSKDIELTPLSATVIRLGEKAKLSEVINKQATPDMLLPKTHPSDLPLEALLLLKNGDQNSPFNGKLTNVKITTKGPIKSSVESIDMNRPVAPVTLTPTGIGKAEITLTCGDVSVTKKLELEKVKARNVVLWTFGNDAQVKLAKGQLPAKRNENARVNESVYEVSFDKTQPVKGKDLALEINPVEVKIDKSKIGGLITKLKIDADLKKSHKNAALQIVMQSEGNHWIILKEIPLNDLKTDWQDIQIPLTDGKHIEVMSKLYAIVFKIKSPKPLTGKLYVDDLGVILRK